MYPKLFWVMTIGEDSDQIQLMPISNLDLACYLRLFKTLLPFAKVQNYFLLKVQNKYLLISQIR